jgi:hypothetical protein
MSDPSNQEKPDLRGEAAWKHQKAVIDQRNNEAKKVGKAAREEYERKREVLRHGAEDREMARFMASQPKH